MEEEREAGFHQGTHVAVGRHSPRPTMRRCDGGDEQRQAQGGAEGLSLHVAFVPGEHEARVTVGATCSDHELYLELQADVVSKREEFRSGGWGGGGVSSRRRREEPCLA
jgi:hypothetical protein